MLGGVGPGLLVMSIEFNKDLNAVVTGLITWVVFTLGVGVSFNHSILIHRIFSGHLSLITLGEDLSSFSVLLSSSERRFGQPSRRVLEVWWRLELSVPLLDLVRRL